MGESQPLISVLMPVRNAALFLSEAVESIRFQTFTNWELICVDDCSTDNSRELLYRYANLDSRIHVLWNRRRRGIGYSLNKALAKTKGSFIARMDADDVSLPDRFEKQLTLLQESDIIACGGQAAIVDQLGEVFAYKKFPTESITLYRMIMKMIPLQHPILMAKAEVLGKYRYQEHLKTAEDVDMLFYLLSKGKLTNVPSVIYKYRKVARSNGYKNVKETFSITFATRFLAIRKYRYRPTLAGIAISMAQFIVVYLLPSTFTVWLFEAFRFEPPVWKKPLLRANELLQLVEPSLRQTQPAIHS